MPRLSVCVPTYNGASFLRRCLDSLLVQTGCDLEILIGDDASTDDTVEIARSYHDPRIHVEVGAERLGLGGNWRRTWARATGDYAALVGQDDWVAPHWAETLVGLLESHPDASLAFGRRDFAFADEESRAAVGDFFEHRYPEMLGPFHARLETRVPAAVMVEEAMKFAFEINLIGEPSFVIVRRNHTASLDGFDASMAQMIDWEFFTRFFVGAPVVHTPRSVGTYHIHARASSIENSPLSKHYREYDYLLGVLLERFAAVLNDDQRATLLARRDEVKGLAIEHAAKEEAS